MGLFRRGQVVCACGRQVRVEVSGRAQFADKACACGARHRIPVGDAWYAAWRDPSGRYVRRKIGARRAAQRVLEKVRTEIAEGRYVDRRPKGSKTLGDLEHKYCYGKTLRDTCAFRMARKTIGSETKLVDITTRRLEEYIDQRTSQGIKLGTVRREFAALGGAMSLAVKLGWIQSKPKIPRPRVDDRVQRFLSREEAASLLSHSFGHVRPFIVCALATGMRQGEILKMVWGWIDLKHRMISLPAASTKSDKVRYVPINSELVALLIAIREGREPQLNERVFRWEYSPSLLRRDFAIGAVRAGLVGLRFHDLRHTAASWMVQGGVDLLRVGQILGHSDYRMTQRYAHLAPDHLHQAIHHTEIGPGFSLPEISQMAKCMEYKP